MIAVPWNALPKTAVEPKDTSWVALAYKSASEDLMQDSICIPVGGSHCITAPACLTAELFAAVVGFKLVGGAYLMVLGQDVDAIDMSAREELLTRTSVLPAKGGLISYLNAWENISLPLGFHRPKLLPNAAPVVLDLLSGFGMEPRALLAKMPSVLTAREKLAVVWTRVLLESPALVLAEASGFGREADPALGMPLAAFSTAYQLQNPAGTFIQLENTPGN
jgi:hypothetical protein